MKNKILCLANQWSIKEYSGQSILNISNCKGGRYFFQANYLEAIFSPHELRPYLMYNNEKYYEINNYDRITLRYENLLDAYYDLTEAFFSQNGYREDDALYPEWGEDGVWNRKEEPFRLLDNWVGVFQENIQYTFYFSCSGPGNSSYIKIIYTDGTTSDWLPKNQYVVSANNKTISHLETITPNEWIALGLPEGEYIYLDENECGVFYGDRTNLKHFIRQNTTLIRTDWESGDITIPTKKTFNIIQDNGKYAVDTPTSNEAGHYIIYFPVLSK